MTSAVVFKFKEDGKTHRIAITFKWGDDIYSALIARLKEYGYVPGGKKKLYYVDYCNDSTLIEDMTSLWSVMEEGQVNYGSGSAIIIEALSKPRKKDNQPGGTCGFKRGRSRSRSHSESRSRSGSRTAKSESSSEGESNDDAGATTDHSHGRQTKHGRRGRKARRDRDAGGETGGVEKRLRRLEEQLEQLMKTLEKRH